MLQEIEENGVDSASENGDDNNNNEELREILEGWVQIQQNTFLNWMNDKLRTFDLQCSNFQNDLKDGVMLCRLMEVLKGHKIGKIRVKKRMSQIEGSGNIALALQTMKDDGVKLVNIGAADIANGNIKLILGLMWSLIRHYQIGSQSKLPPKKLMLSWVNAVLHPHKTVKNFSTDWNDGIALHGVIEFCKPGTFPEWFHLNASDRLANCESAMTTAKQLFDIPLVVTPKNLASRDLDELSGMTYLSYFMSEGSPGYKATLAWVHHQTPDTPVSNFDKDWNNGFVLSSFVTSLGGAIPGWPSFNTSDWVSTITIAMDVSKSQLGVEPVLSARDMVQEDVDHIGVMAYAAWHRHVGETEPITSPPPRSTTPPPPVIVTPPTPTLEERSPTPIEERPPTPEPVIENPPIPLEVNTVMAPVETPVKPQAVQSIVRYARDWRINAVQTIVVYTKSLGDVHLKGAATSPDGRNVALTSFSSDDHIYCLSFLPTLKGEWSIHLTALDSKTGDEMAIPGSPCSINVYDVFEVLLDRDEEQSTIALGSNYTFQVLCSDCGLHDLDTYVLYDGETMEHSIKPGSDMCFDVAFKGAQLGIYTVALYCGGIEVTGSPFDIVCKDVSKVVAKGPGLSAGAIGHETRFVVDYTECEFGHVTVDITSQDGETIDAPVRVKETGMAEIVYTPPLPGTYTVKVAYDNIPVQGSPFIVEVGNKKVFIRDVKEVSYVGQPDSFKVDASAAGKGQLEIDSDLPIREYKTIGERIYSITYVPKKPGKHDLTVKYNGIIVEGCPCSIDVRVKSEEAETGEVDTPTTNGDATIPDEG